MRFFRANGLTIVLLLLFAVSILGLAGWEPPTPVPLVMARRS